VDSSGNAYVTGYTSSANFPTANAFQAAFGGLANAFVAKLNAAGSALAYSTYLGGSGFDYGQGIAVDSSSNAYVTGTTSSTNFPTASAFQATHDGPPPFGDDAFVTKLNAAGSALVYSTYLGGNDDDEGYGIAVDSSGSAYVTGKTYSANFPTANAFQVAAGGDGDAFVTKLNATGSVLVYSTYLGGNDSDVAYGIAVDSSGNAYVTGYTSSANFPTAKALHAVYGGGTDAFVTKFPAETVKAPPFAGSMAQIASGGGWETTLTLVNMGVNPSQAVLNFFGNDGSPLQLPLTFQQTSSSTGPLIVSTLDQTLNANSLLVLDSQQPGNPNAQVGSTQLLTNGNVGGFAIFKYTPTGQEAVVPLETRNAPSFVLAFDNTGVLGTGVAIANVATQRANIPLVIRDDNGTQIGTDTINLEAQGHTSFMLNATYDITKDKRGTVEFDTPPSGQISALGLRANGSSLTTLPVLAQVTASGGSMAQVASGGGWQSTFTLVNTGASSAQAQLSFFDDNGNPLSLPLTFVQSGAVTTSSTVVDVIAAGATLVILTHGNNTGASVVGSAQLTTTGDVSGFAIFRYNPTGQEAVVPLEARNASAYVLAFDNTGGLATGLALANISNQAANVPVVLRDDAGTSLGTATINLAARGHTSFMLTASYPSVASKRGTVEFDSPAGMQISVLGLRATPSGAVTTIPVLEK
jgi:hypothetical protein